MVQNDSSNPKKSYLQWLILIESHYITYIIHIFNILNPQKSGGLELSFRKSPESEVHKQLQGPALTSLRESINATVAPIKEIKAPMCFLNGYHLGMVMDGIYIYTITC